MKERVLKFIKKTFSNPEHDKKASRKYTLALLIFSAATIMCAIPPALAVFVFKTAPLIILSGSEWISVMGMLGGFYFGANVLQKKFIKDSEMTIIPPKEGTPTEEKKEDIKQ